MQRCQDRFAGWCLQLSHMQVELNIQKLCPLVKKAVVNTISACRNNLIWDQHFLVLYCKYLSRIFFLRHMLYVLLLLFCADYIHTFLFKWFLKHWNVSCIVLCASVRSILISIVIFYFCFILMYSSLCYCDNPVSPQGSEKHHLICMSWQRWHI